MARNITHLAESWVSATHEITLLRHDIDCDDMIHSSVVPQERDGQRFGDTSVRETKAVEVNRGANSRNGRAGMYRMGNKTILKDMRSHAVQISGDDDQITIKFGKVSRAQITFQVLADFLTTDQSFGRWDDEIQQLLESGTVFDFPSAKFQRPAIKPCGPKRPDISSHAATGHGSNWDVVFLQNLNNARMRQTTGTTARENEADARRFFPARAVSDAFLGTAPSSRRKVEIGVHGLRWLFCC